MPTAEEQRKRNVNKHDRELAQQQLAYWDTELKKLGYESLAPVKFPRFNQSNPQLSIWTYTKPGLKVIRVICYHYQNHHCEMLLETDLTQIDLINGTFDTLKKQNAKKGQNVPTEFGIRIIKTLSGQKLSCKELKNQLDPTPSNNATIDELYELSEQGFVEPDTSTNPYRWFVTQKGYDLIPNNNTCKTI